VGEMVAARVWVGSYYSSGNNAGWGQAMGVGGDCGGLRGCG